MELTNLSTQLFAAVSALGGLACILLLTHKKVHTLQTLACIFCILALASAGTRVPGSEGIKYARIAVTVLSVVLAISVFRTARFGRSGGVLLAFFLVYTLSALWSTEPLAGLIFKGQFLLTFTAGLVAVSVIETKDGLKTFIVLMSITTVALSVFIFIDFVRNPEAMLHIGRLAAWGINPNRIGQSLAPLAIFSIFLIVYGWSLTVKAVAIATTLFAVFLVLYTGSRGGLGMLCIGAMVVIAPKLRHPVRLLVISAVFGAGLYATVSIIAPEAATDRLEDTTFETREMPWGEAMKYIRSSPIIGHGFISYPSERGVGTQTNFHSIYLQILVETGVLGMAAFTAVVLWLFWDFAVQVKALVTHRMSLVVAGLAAATMLAVLAHGVIESGGLFGSTVNALMFGIGACLMGRVHDLTSLTQSERA